MAFWNETLCRLRYLWQRSRFDRELDAELEFHIESRADELVETGVPRTAALARARREFGPSARARGETRSAWQFAWIEDLFADLRYAARAFRRNPAFGVTAALCLALGIGANTTIFSIAAEILFCQPSVRNPESLVSITIGGDSHSPMHGYRAIRDAGIFAAMAGANENMETNWRHGDAADRLFAILATGNFFETAGIPLAMGRPLEAGDTSSVVISHRFWESRLGGGPNAIGRSLVLDGRPFVIAGVLPADHRTVFGPGFAPDLYMPLSGDAREAAFFARLQPGATRQSAAAQLQGLCRQLEQTYPGEDWGKGVQVTAISGLDRLESDRGLLAIAAFFGMLMIVAALVLAIACANVASLLLARASSRTHELAIRVSIGAGRGRIVRQLLAESLLLALLGTAAGLGLNLGLTSMAPRIRLPLPLPVQLVISPDWRLLDYAIALTIGTSLLAGLAPALKGARVGIAGALKQSQRQVARGQWTLGNVLVVGQLAVSIVLLSAAVLFLRNFAQASGMNPGFDIPHTVWASVRLVPEEYPGDAKIRPLVDTALERLRGLPGVEAASAARVVPLTDAMNYQMPVRTDLSGESAILRWNGNYVSAGYFQTMQIPILEGREFLPTDGPGAPAVAILNQNMARRLFGDANPVGHVVWLGGGNPVRIAGVARNAKYMTLGEANVLAVYQPYSQDRGTSVNLQFLVRAAGPAPALLSAVRDELHRLDPTAALEVKTMQDGLGLALLPSRAGSAILGSMGLLGIALASIGLYGVLLYSVSRRIREIGLRVALGATPGAILKSVAGQSASLVATGTVIGLVISVVAVRPLAMFLTPEVRTTDAANFAVVAAALVLVAMAATIAPALRALRVDPAVALRD